MKSIEDSTLMAYLDGELDKVTTSEIEALVARDPELKSKVQDFRQCDALVRAAFGQAISGAGRSTPSPIMLNAQRKREKKTLKQWAPLPIALAASLAVLLIGGMTGLAMLDSLVKREFERQALIKEKDKQAIAEARSSALERKISGTEVSWTNPDSGNFGTMIPVKTWRTKTGRYCREFEESITIDGAVNVERGVACRTEDGKWKVRLRYFPE